MASTTVAVTPGTGADVGFDDVTMPDGSTAASVQAVKQAVGGEGEASWVSGRLVDGETDEAAAFVEQRGDVAEAIITPTLTALTYTAGEAMGAVWSISNAAKAAGGGVRIDSLFVIDLDSESADLDVMLFRDSIAAVTDSAVFDPSDADLAKFRGSVSIAAADWKVLNDNAAASKANIGLVIPSLVGTTLYGVLVSRSGDTYTGTGDVTIVVGFTRL